MALYIGTNYHPHDWTEKRWKEDICLMKEAGFNTVRLGHLCWDSYEPEEGVYTFEWFDEVMDLFSKAGIKVVLDVSMHPAPRWVHKLCPGCRIYNKSGIEQDSLTRYMEDVSDPAYQKYALRFARILVRRYKDHPALLAFGLCNELGAGFISYSPEAQYRFQNWLKKKYHTINKLNETWATQRWSRRFNSFDEIMLQENEISIGPPEGWLDMRRFFSDGIGNFIVRLKETVEENAPGALHSSNHYAEKDSLGFDYLQYADHFVDYPGIGLYPGYEPGNSHKWRSMLACYMQRVAETGRPMWCLEFQTGSAGLSHGPYGINRMHILLSLLYRSQMVLGWTFRSMLGGEEQYLYGMLGHDGVPGANYEEYRQVVRDFKKLEKYAFPYLPEPEIGVAYSYDNMLVMQYSPAQYRTSYQEQVMEALQCFDKQNIDYNIVDLRNIKKHYKLLIIPGYAMMSREAAETIRTFVADGGTVVMTGYSAMTDETGKVFAEPHPGYLADVFGIRVKGYLRTEEGEKTLTLKFEEQEVKTDLQYYEELELNTAECIAELKEQKICGISRNFYGKGCAYYMSVEAEHRLLGQLIKSISEKAGLATPIYTPEGVVGRKIAEGQYFYVNTLQTPVTVKIQKNGHGVLHNKVYSKEIVLDPFDGELIVENN